MNEKITVSEYDFNRLTNLMKFYPAPKLEEELNRADVINDILVLPDLVTLDSNVLYTIDRNFYQSTLVSEEVPEDQDSCVSVLDELGTALLGLRENQEIRWFFPEGERQIRVLSVIYQPEAMGDLHPLSFH
ncbi:MAG: hypothetical protein ACLGHN_01350 [Bacteriovoracia bacterium]